MRKAMHSILILSIVILISQIVAQDNEFTPTRLRLSYTDDPNEMMITWTTSNDPGSSSIEYGLSESSLNITSEAITSYFRNFTIHRAVAKNLGQNSNVWYRCGSLLNWSEVNKFVTRNLDTNSSLKVVMFGDLGIVNGQSIPSILADVSEGMYDVIHHVGDIAYDMDENNGQTGQIFLSMMENASKVLPYMVSPGNHESENNFEDYRNQYSMPGGTQNMYYSYNIGPIHFVSISTEFYYYWKQNGFVPLIKHYYWLKNDLENAAKPENRKKHPWIIVMGHRPMYCSTSDSDDCTFQYALTRVGVPFIHLFAMEELLYKNGVDLAIWAHEHIYERMWPVYNLKVYNGSYTKPYTNPGATVHIVTGSAGCRERHDDFKKVHPPYSALRNSDYGYSRVHIANTTHLHFEQISDDKGGKVVDELWLVRDTHGPFEE